VPALILLWAVWRDVYVLEANGLHHLGGRRAHLEWLALSLATVAVAVLFCARERALRVLGYTIHALVLSVGCGVAGVLGVMHGLGGPQGNLASPGWALVLLGLFAALCVAALLATAALIVEDVRQGDSEELDLQQDPP
jgi:hypothetical protein